MAEQEEKRPDDANTQPPTTAPDEQTAPDVALENSPSAGNSATPVIPTANAPNPGSVNAGDNPNAAKSAVAKKDKPASPSDAAVKPAKAKKEKAPALEDKPFNEFIQQDYLPTLKKGLETMGARPLEIFFEKRKIPIKGYDSECWQVIGKWQPSYKQTREFNIYFFEDSINGLKGFACAEANRLSTMESFLIDERKVTLDLLVFGAVQRLNGQKWLTRN